MSTEFYFCNPATKQHIDHLYAHWPEFQEQFQSLFHKFCLEAPSCDEAASFEADMVEKMISNLGAYSIIPNIPDDGHSVGVSISSRFEWNERNGFRCLQDLERYMQEHPKERLFNEYGVEYTLEEFKKREGL